METPCHTYYAGKTLAGHGCSPKFLPQTWYSTFIEAGKVLDLRRDFKHSAVHFQTMLSPIFHRPTAVFTGIPYLVKKNEPQMEWDSYMRNQPHGGLKWISLDHKVHCPEFSNFSEGGGEDDKEEKKEANKREERGKDERKKGGMEGGKKKDGGREEGKKGKRKERKERGREGRKKERKKEIKSNYYLG